jgi:phosphatidylinositol alpha 1,6-mannosyltransferase
VIVSDIGGPRDLVEHGTDGLITKGHDGGELTEAIRTLANDSTLRINMGKAARSRVESRNWTEAFEQFWNASPE